MKVWIDTDVGSDVDDAIALVLALRHPEVELAGVSTVFGDTPLRAAIARELVGPDVPVLAGIAEPRTSGKRGIMFGFEHEHAAADFRPERSGPAQLVEAIASSEADALVAIGPLTNVAAVLDAGYAPRRLVLMGGLLGRIERAGRPMRAEHNFACDPHAAARVVAHGRVTVVPFDVTVRTRLPDDARRAIARAQPQLAGPMDLWIRFLVDRGAPPESTGVYLHDPLALLALTDPDLVTVGPRKLGVVEDGVVVEGDAEHDVVVDADVPAVQRRLLQLLA